MTTKRMLNYTTKISAKRTAGECMDLLADSGAEAVALTYTEKRPASLSFALDTVAGRRHFQLPVNVAGVAKVLADMANGAKPPSNPGRDRLLSAAHASDVAWRVLRDWLEAQLALIDAQMATLEEIMLPYLLVGEDQTLFQRYLESGQAALEAGA